MTGAKRSTPAFLVLAMLLAGIAAQAQPPQGESNSTPEATKTTAPQIPKRVRVSSSVAAGLLLQRVNPEYPPKARNQRIQGVVMMDATLSREGDVIEVAVTSGDPVLAEAAVKAAKKWKYKPYLIDGNAVEVETRIQMNFNLAN